eukprot:Pompholyxophrys_sp_v1_NODE_22_length_3962_cov_1.921423.p3 type:complete len:190 gc:universal NODE_22_length_3962_cov_1.921423:2264-2833(+)
MPLCTSITKQGQPCSRKSTVGLTRCKQHEIQHAANQMKLAMMAPKELEVFYGYNTNDDNDNIDIHGQYLTVEQTQEEPCTDFSMLPNTYYTVVMIDPDAPGPKALGKSYLHLMETNIDKGHGVIDPVIPYKGPSPPPNSGDHHYIFYLLEQEGPIDISEPIDRTTFDLSDFMKNYHLKHKVDNRFIIAT